MAQSKHKTCSAGNSLEHEPFGDRRKADLHNSCMEQSKDSIAVEMGARVRSQRDARGWTQRDLARQTGWKDVVDDGEQKGVLSPSRIGNWEQGTRRIRHEEAEILSRVFGLPPAYFLVVVSEQEATVLAAMRQQPAPRTGTSAH